MELHHKLRRDPNWHPNACNICGGVRYLLLVLQDAVSSQCVSR